MQQLPNHSQLQQANQLFQNKNFTQAIKIYQEYIEKNSLDFVDIDGLGNNQVSLGYYEWFIPEWYIKGIKQGLYRGTPYDYLSLSYLCSKVNEETMLGGIKWYRKMVDRRHQDHRLTLGLAHILSNKAYYQQGLEYYRKTTQLKPNWTAPYECIAYIYQYKRIEKSKSIEAAKKLLQVDPCNRSGLFVLARNEKDPDQKIEKLKKITEIHPLYSRACNQIGIVYGGSKKMYDQAIYWYKKCTVITPLYASCYNNIGVNYELKKQQKQAIKWYFQGILRDREYKAPHTNLIDCFQTLKYSDQKIDEQMRQNNVVHCDYFYYYLGLAYYDKGKNQLSIKYYMKANNNANDLAKDIHKLYNSIGITYDEMKDYENAIIYYNLSIQKCPTYHSAYYNLGIVQKTKGNLPKAIELYKKAIQINPRYSYAYNNLGNIYKNQANYEQAIKCYKKAVQNLSTYTLALANLGICYLKLKNYRDAFNAMARAKEMLATDNNNLSASNKTFLRETLQKFDREGQQWRQNGIVTQQLKGHVQNYESKFKTLYSNLEKEPVNLQKVMKDELLQILKLIKGDEFSLANIEPIYQLLDKLYVNNEEYFHILPQVFIQYFYKSVFQEQKQINHVEQKLYETIGLLQTSVAFDNMAKNDEIMQQRSISTTSIKNYIGEQAKIDLFNGKAYFEDYQQFISQIDRAHLQAKGAYSEFKSFVDQVRKQSKGIPFGVCIKLTNNQHQRFLVILRIINKVFETEFARNRVKSLNQLIFNKFLQNIKEGHKTTLEDIQNYCQKAIANQVTSILQKRKENKVQTVAQMGDFLRGKIVFESVDHLKKAVVSIGQISTAKNYKVIKMQNRLVTPYQDFVINVIVKDSVCELKLSLNQNDNEFNLLKLLQNIEKCPLGSVFGSILMLYKQIQYSLVYNCQDIVEYLTQNESDQKKQILQNALYVLTTLNESCLTFK